MNPSCASIQLSATIFRWRSTFRRGFPSRVAPLMSGLVVLTNLNGVFAPASWRLVNHVTKLIRTCSKDAYESPNLFFYTAIQCSAKKHNSMTIRQGWNRSFCSDSAFCTSTGLMCLCAAWCIWMCYFVRRPSDLCLKVLKISCYCQ